VYGRQNGGRQRKRWINTISWQDLISLNLTPVDVETTGEEEPEWLTPHLRDSQPEGERERF